MSLIGCLLIACTSHPHRHYPVLLRQLPDISHTPSRHPTDIPRHTGEKELADQNESNQIFINSFHIIPPTTQSHPRQYTKSHSDNLRHLPDIFQEPYRHPKSGHSMANPGHWEKSKQPIKTILIVLSLEFH